MNTISFTNSHMKAVNEANAEMNLQDDNRILVGGPVVTGDIIKKMNLFFKNYSRDTSANKKMDFVSWHEYSKSYDAIAHREKQVRSMLDQHSLKENIPYLSANTIPIILRREVESTILSMARD